MAFFANNHNVGPRCFVKNNQIIVLNTSKNVQNESNNISTLTCTQKDNTTSTKQPKNDIPNIITSVSISNDGQYLSACDSSYSLHLWQKKDSDWNVVSVRTLIRKGQKIIFTNSTHEILLADRGGDVYSYSVSEAEQSGKYLLGHICFILDVAISSDDRFLATCDRDGKIRISHYPNCYNIVNYCLGHEEFVSSLLFADTFLLSTSGDGTVRIWNNFKDGHKHKCLTLFSEEVDKTDFDEKRIEFSIRRAVYSSPKKLLALTFYMQKDIVVYKLSGDEFVLKQKIPFDTTVLDAMFDDNSGLFVLLRNDVDAFKYFSFCEKEELLKCQSSESFNSVQDFYSSYDVKLNFSDDFVSMFKRAYDATDDDDISKLPNKKNKEV